MNTDVVFGGAEVSSNTTEPEGEVGPFGVLQQDQDHFFSHTRYIRGTLA